VGKLSYAALMEAAYGVYMNSECLFKMALGIELPWEIIDIKFENLKQAKTLNIKIDFKKGSRFQDETGALCEIHDTVQKTWRHLNFFEHACYLHCRVPRIKTSNGKVKLIDVPWARAGSGFTLLFEAYVMALIENEMPVNKIGYLIKENPHRLWTIFNYWLRRAYDADQPKIPKKLGLDETSKKKGHDYVTLAVDLDERRVLHVSEGKDKNAVKAVKTYLESKGINTNKVRDVSMDMSPSFIAGASEHFPKAQIHFDRFHVVKLLNEAMNKVRQEERKEHAALKGHKYTFLKNRNNLSASKEKVLSELITLYPTLGEAYRLKELFNDLWEMDDEEEATGFLVNWCKEVEKSNITPFKQFVKTVKAHWTGIVNFCEKEINNGVLEGINSKVQLAKKRARGYRCTENFINMIYFLCGKLKFDYPLYSS
jgi:transposase